MNQSTKPTGKITKIVIGIIIAAIAIGGIWYGINKNRQVAPGEIKIGAILPMTGDLANFGNDISKGMNLFAEQHPDLKLVIENDEGDPKKSISAMKKLSSIDGIHYFYGPFGPVAAEAVYSAQSESEKGLFTFVAMSMCTDQFKNYENMICNYPTPYYQLKESYKHPKTLGKTNFYVITSNDAFGESILQMMGDVAKELELNLLGSEKVNASDMDFSISVRKIIQTNPEFIVVATMDQPANIRIIKNLKEAEYKGMIYDGGDFEEKMVKEFQGVLEGVYLTGQPKLDYSSDFSSLYSQKYGEGKPSVYTAYGYVWADILYNLAKSHPKDQFTIQDMMDYVNSHPNDLAISGLNYDQTKREIEFPMQVFVVENGELKSVFVSSEE